MKLRKKKYTSIYIVSDSYFPQKISAAGMIYNLSKELASKGIEVTCVVSADVTKDFKKKYNCEEINFINTKLFEKLRNKSLILKFLYEILTALTLALKVYFFTDKKKSIDLIIWYGPSVFYWLVVYVLNLKKTIPVYYILRDIFPDWLVTLKVVKNPLIIWFLKLLSDPQYKVSNVIGLETLQNVYYLQNKLSIKKKFEVLYNWPNIVKQININLDQITENKLNEFVKKNKDYKILNFLYLGNTSVAHDYESFIKFLNLYNKQLNLFKFEINIFGKYHNCIKSEKINIKQRFWGNIPNHNVDLILSNVDCGIVSLNRNALTHNIPGKFVSYTQFKLPILCFANINSPLAKLISKYDCGIVIDLNNHSEENWRKLSIFIRDFEKKKVYFSKKSFKLFTENFDTKVTANQILNSF